MPAPSPTKRVARLRRPAGAGLRLTLGWASKHARRFGTAVLNSGRWAEVEPRSATGIRDAADVDGRPGREPLGGDYPNNFTGDNVRRVLGVEPRDLATSSFFDRIHPDDRAAAKLELELLLARGRSVQEYRFLHGDGTYHWILDENLVIHEADDQPARIVGFLADVTEQHHLAAERVLLAAAMDQTTDAILLIGLDGSISFANAAVCAMTGRTAAEMVGMHTSALANNETLKPLYEASMEAGFSGRRWTGSITVNWTGNRAYDLDVAVWPLMVEHKVSSLVVIMRDVTNEHVLSASLQRQTDERAAVADAFARLRQGGTPTELAAVAVHDLAGIEGVDIALLVGFPSGPGVARIAADGRPLTVDPWLLVDGCGAYLRRRMEAGRTLEDWTDHRDAHEQLSCTWGRTGLKAARLEPLTFDDAVVGGVVLGSTAAGGRSRLEELAPLIAEYGALIASVVGPEMAQRRQVGGTRAAIERVLSVRAFHSVFQPVMNITGRTVVGYEALTRFADGTPPDRRFAEAAAVGLGLELETATLAAALAAARDLPAGCWLSLNASPELILQRDLLTELFNARGRRTIILEVTEHAAVEDYVALREAVAVLGQGIEIAVDDAGAGFASLRHVIELRPEYVKLDIGLIRGVDQDDARRALVAGMVHFAMETGCDLIAEGIETEEELDALRKLGITLGQGFLLGRPARLSACDVQ